MKKTTKKQHPNCPACIADRDIADITRAIKFTELHATKFAMERADARKVEYIV